MGDELYARFSDGLNEEAPVSIRINRLKSRGRSVAGTAVNVPWCGDGRYLPQRPDFTFDPLLHAGCYYVQEASSMFVHHVLRSLVSTPVLMLDMCAAPGGKSTAAASALPEGSILMSNEPVRARANILAENMMKWGSPDVIVTNNYPRDYVRSGLDFDVILCDVPCSGEGMFRKDEGAVEEWSPQNVDACSRLQREIVADAWQCLRPGGLLIYSTCTFNATENEENIRWIVDELGGMPVGSLLADFTAPVYRFIPGCTRGEGLFMAVLRKSPDAESPIILRKGKRYVQDKYDNGNKKRKDKAIAASWCQGILKRLFPDGHLLYPEMSISSRLSGSPMSVSWRLLRILPGCTMPLLCRSVFFRRASLSAMSRGTISFLIILLPCLRCFVLMLFP